MASFPTARATALDALLLCGAVGDVEAGRDPGHAERVARLAARFAERRGLDAAGIDAAWYAALTADLGRIRIRVPADASERVRAVTLWDAPLAGARFLAQIPGLPIGTPDLVRWHREAFDGTGFPDRLRWNGIPYEASAVGIIHDFAGRIAGPEHREEPEEALFAIVGEAGRLYDVELVTAFQQFVLTGGLESEPYLPAEPPPGAAAAMILRALVATLDERDERPGRSERRAAIARAIAPAVEVDPEDAADAARLTVVGEIGAGEDWHDLDPLSRFARDVRAGHARRAAQIAAAGGAYGAFADALGASAERFDGSGPQRLKGAAIPALGRVLTVAITAELLDAQSALGASAADAAQRIGAAAGTHVDPVLARALASAGVSS